MILHAVWTRRRLHLWAEGMGREIPADSGDAKQGDHPFAIDATALARVLGDRAAAFEADSAELTLPCGPDGRPWASPRLLSLLGEEPEERQVPTLERIRVPTLVPPDGDVVAWLLALEAAEPEGVRFGHELRFWFALAREVAEWLADQRVVPSLVADPRGFGEARWLLWTGDADARSRVDRLAAAMPAAARCGTESPTDPVAAIDQATTAWADAIVRGTLRAEEFEESIDSWDDPVDPHVVWLGGLLRIEPRVDCGAGRDLELPRRVRSWLARLEDERALGKMRLRLLLVEPDEAMESSGPIDRTGSVWTLRFGLAEGSDPEAPWFDPADIVAGLAIAPGGAAAGADLEETLLTELAKAARIWPRLEAMLQDPAAGAIPISTAETYALLREHRPILEESGILLEVPAWWGDPSSRLAARLKLDPIEAAAGGEGPVSGSGLDRVVGYRWELVLGGESVSFDQFRRLAADGVPLVRVENRWVEIRPEDLVAARRFLEGELAGETTLRDALRMAHGLDASDGGLMRAGIEASGWIADLIDGTTEAKVETIEPPARFQGTLRPYQQSGLSWLAFLDRIGIGACLADDMGLGKTVQLIALLQHERERGDTAPGPTLIVAPMSVVGNWQRELERFAPELAVHRHHGLDRPIGDRFVEIAQRSDVVLTTYGLVGRDLDFLQRLHWRRVVLDEAQHVKNPPTKQATAIRTLRCDQRIALTGTPVENRLAELWSILEFCCPGYLGTAAEFRRRFAMPIERHRDRTQAERLRALVRPFVLRRLKTDPTVISDLPPLVESRQHVPLTDEQASLYETTVASMLRNIESSDGMRRRGLVLAGLVRLKQICNHPAQFLGEEPGDGVLPETFIGRSGKAARLVELLEELIAAGDRALVFTQYRQMGHLLAWLVRRVFDVDPIFLHGGTPSGRREQLIDRFQSGDPSCPVFILSLRAGGVGLNLTAARHVIHYDRWWNPAVENQATDRAFRIGQTRTVHVHKMVSTGTLEERIDRMIEQKTELAEQVVGSGESWITELSTGQLRDLLELRRSAFEEAASR
ncbi:MAG: DEAD/DEAH box helicase [Phycisphaerales bacterium]